MSIIELLRITFSGFCAQDPLHSFYIGLNQLLLCARCSGIYFGIFAFFIFYLLTRSRGKFLLINFIIALVVNFIYFLIMKIFNYPYNKFLTFLFGNYLGFFFGGTIIYNLYWDKNGRADPYKMFYSLFFSISLFIIIVFILKWYLLINIFFLFILLTSIFLILYSILKRGFRIKTIYAVTTGIILTLLMTFYKLIVRAFRG